MLFYFHQFSSFLTRKSPSADICCKFTADIAAIKVNWDSNIAIIQIPPSILLISYRKRVCDFYLEKINVIYLKVK